MFFYFKLYINLYMEKYHTTLDLISAYHNGFFYTLAHIFPFFPYVMTFKLNILY